jgi:hypothetical protein
MVDRTNNDETVDWVLRVTPKPINIDNYPLEAIEAATDRGYFVEVADSTKKRVKVFVNKTVVTGMPVPRKK